MIISQNNNTDEVTWRENRLALFFCIAIWGGDKSWINVSLSADMLCMPMNKVSVESGIKQQVCLDLICIHLYACPLSVTLTIKLVQEKHSKYQYDDQKYVIGHFPPKAPTVSVILILFSVFYTTSGLQILRIPLGSPS